MTTTYPLELRGPMKALYSLPMQYSMGKRVREVLISSAAGTGKSMGIAATFVEWARHWPGSRFVVFRQERTRLAETWQNTFEQHVCPLYGIDPGAGTKIHKRGYTIPCEDGGTSEILLGGLDDPQKWYSFEANAALYVECNEVAQETYETIFRALRWPYGMPAHFTVLETNPDSPMHWIYKRFGLYPKCGTVKLPGRVAMSAEHKDNPAYWDSETESWTELGKEFIESLDLMSGVRLRRLRWNEWCQAEGAVYEHYDPATHIIRGQMVKENGRWWLVQETDKRQFDAFFGAMDWGMKAPGTFGVWGIDSAGHMILVAEWYMTGQNDNDWADIVTEAHEKYGLVKVVCDSAGKSGIDVFNDRLTPIGGRAGHRMATEANKDVLTGISMVHDKLGPMADGEPAIMFLESSLQHAPDPSLVGKAPTRAVEELPGYVWEEIDPNKPFVREKPRKINDHSCDMIRYAAMWRWGVDFSQEPQPFVHRPGTMGALMGFDDEMNRGDDD